MLYRVVLELKHDASDKSGESLLTPGRLAGHTDHPGLGIGHNLGRVRAVITVLQTGPYPHHQGLVNAFVNDRTRYPDLALYLRDRPPVRIMQHPLRPGHLPYRRGR